MRFVKIYIVVCIIIGASLAARPVPKHPAFDRLIQTLPPAIGAVTAINSVPSLTLDNIEKAALAASDLLEALLAARVASKEPSLTLRLETAISSIITFVNQNEMVPNEILIRTGPGQVVIRDRVSGQEKTIDEAKGLLKTQVAVQRLGVLRSQIQNAKTVGDLVQLMGEAQRYQLSLRKIATDLHKVTDAFGAQIDFRPAETFMFHLLS